ncbi:MAG TPA: multidrug ABC transporter ATP-binding protein [Gammaproteobacteria bacterium]|nr:multidrug ABC transporter ATP-binding protein [Gammaproteobacteria bacterium]|tara:strand:- start:571 stop:1425 length:855 start_codon:yes stop_codon:yes gene_type:complete
MIPLVNAMGITKRYGDFTALHEVTFTVEPGSILGLIGPNGAGKTTTLKSLLGLTGFEGELEVSGRDPRKNRHRVMDQVCFVADVGVMPRWLKVSDAEAYVAAVHPRFNRERFRLLIKSTGVLPHQRVRQLSKGMVTQLHLALVLAIEVDLLVLDEPTLGLDIIYRKAFYERLQNDYHDKKKSIIISTHQVEEIESLLTHLIFLDKGRIILDCAMDEVSEIFAEVIVPPENWLQAERFNPINSRGVRGQKVMTFENVPRKELAHLGEVKTPNVADLFVSKVKEDL